MKSLFSAILAFISLSLFAQKENTKGSLTGSFESNSQYYLKDEKRNNIVPDKPFRSNSYLLLQYNYKKWTAGVQGEAYLPQALLNLNPKFKGVGLGTAFINYKTKRLDITAGHFYEQFGSGLILRTWEDRSLGINNALCGGRVKYSPIDAVRLTILAGKQRTGFDLADGTVYGADAEVDLLTASEKQKSELTLGVSYSGRYEKAGYADITSPNFKELTNSFSGRINFSRNNFTASAEYDYKAKDAVLNEALIVDNNFIKPGNALLLNFGYSKKGMGFNLALRRHENMSIFSSRKPESFPGVFISNSSLDFNDKLLNYIPAQTKQHHYNLANIYVFQAQRLLNMIIGKAGEVGGMADFFYEFKKGSNLGGKYGTKVELTYSNYNNLSGTYNFYPPAYETDFPGIGKKSFSDFSLEINKKISKKWRTNISFINQYYNNSQITGAAPVTVKTNIIATEWEYQATPKTGLKWSAEHMWADKDRGNWLAGLFELNLNSKLSFFVSDMFNYGYDETSNDIIDHQTDPFKIHFYNFGSTFKTGTLRISANYGRQRGGLVCTGGICRMVMPSTGFGLTVTKTFSQKQK